MTIVDGRNEALWRRAEELHPRAVCICGYPSWRHWPETRPDWHSRAYDDLCAGPVRAAEVAAEYERLVAAEVAAALDGPASGETMFWLPPNSPLKFNTSTSNSYAFGFFGFKWNGAAIVQSRYSPGMVVGVDPAGPWEAPLIRTWERGGFVDVPFVPGTAPLLDEVWGWEREAVRRFLAPKIVKPEPRAGVEWPFPVVVLDAATLAERTWDAARGETWGTVEPTPIVPDGWALRPQPLVVSGTWGDVAKWLSERATPKSLIEVVHELPPQLVGFRSGVVLYG